MSRPTSARFISGVVRGGIAFALVAALGWAPTPAAAQATGTLVGTVRDAASQRPLEAVQVYIAGSGVGALTNAAGRFLMLNVAAGEHTLVAELVGYRSGTQVVTVAAGQSAAADFNLEQTAIALDEIVVTGAGVATERRKLGNTIATLDASTLENAPISDFSQMIAGREPGVVSLPSSGYTGEGARIRIRGSASLSQLNEPIIYVDGVRVNSRAVEAWNGQGQPSRLDDIPPESIERVEILKGAAAATLYGTEASNGVIQIFTKRGRAGAPRFTAQADWTAINAPTNRILPVADFIGRSCSNVACDAVATADDPSDAAVLADAQSRVQARFGRSVTAYEPFEEDIVPEAFSTGFGQVYSASATGGSDAFQYFVSGRLTDENGPYDLQKNFTPVEGITPEDDTNRRASITSNFTIVPSSKIRIGISSLYSDMEHHTPDNGNNIYGAFSSMLMTQLRLVDVDDNYYGSPAFATNRENMYQLNFVNSAHFSGSTNIGFTPTESFRLDATFGVDFASDDAVAFRPYGWNVDGFSGSTIFGSRAVSEERTEEYTADLKGSYIFESGIIENTFLFGGQGFLSQYQFAGGSGNEFPGPGFSTLSALANEGSFEFWRRVTQIGGYLQDQLGYDDWVFATVGGRWDANSAFGENFNTAFYPKASISLVPSQGLDWSNATLSTMRVRAAVGKSGLQPGAFDRFTTFSPQTGADGAGVEPENLGNADLAPEVSTEWEVGTELGLFDDRVSLDLTYWNRTVDDALVERQYPVTGGFVDEQLTNIGQLKGSGWEINARGTVLQREGLSLNLFANTAYLSEKITDMGGAPPLKTGGSYPRYRNFLVEGFAPGSFFGAQTAGDLAIPLNILDPIVNADGSLTCAVPTEADALTYFGTPRNPSDFKPLTAANSTFGTPIAGEYASHNCGSGLLDTYLGKPTPDWAGSFGFNLAFATNFELASLFEYKWGNYSVQDLSGMFRRANSVIGRNTPRSAELGAIMANPASTAQERLDAAVAWAQEIEGLSPMSGMNGVYDASFIRWRELSLTYRVPSDVIEGWGLTTATVNLGVRNLHLFMPGSDYPGMDPEGNVHGRCNGGLDCNFLDSTEGWGLPIPRRFTFSTRVTF